MLKLHINVPRAARVICMLVVACVSLAAMTACSLGNASLFSDSSLYVPTLLEKAQQYNGKNVVVSGAYVGKGGDPATSVLALGVSTADNGLDAQPLGEQIWLDGFPESSMKNQLHQPGDAVYGFVRVNGLFESGGGYGPDNKYKYRIQVASAEPIERVQRSEARIQNAALGDGKVSLFELTDNPGQYNGKQVTTQGYYFWNGQIFVLAEGVSYEKTNDNDQVGSSPQPVGRQIWMEGFPPDKSAALNVGPNNSFVWGKVEVTGDFKTGGGFGKDGAYRDFLQVTSATPLQK